MHALLPDVAGGPPAVGMAPQLHLLHCALVDTCVSCCLRLTWGSLLVSEARNPGVTGSDDKRLTATSWSHVLCFLVTWWWWVV